MALHASCSSWRPALAQPLLRRLAWLGGVGLLAGLGGCALPSLPSLPKEPWVKPYERERLADPIMQFQRDGMPEKHREHVYSVREAAHGATGVQGGGCGCN